MISSRDRIENIVEKGENFSPFSTMFSKVVLQKLFTLNADDKTNVAQVKISVYERVEYILGKGHNHDFQNFLPFSQNAFEKFSSSGS